MLWALARTNQHLHRHFCRLHESCTDDKIHYHYVQVVLYFITAVIDILVIASIYAPTWVERLHIFPPSIESIRLYMDHHGHFLAFSITMFSGAFFFMSRNYLTRIRHFNQSVKGLHKTAHTSRNVSDKIVEIKREANIYYDYNKRSKYFTEIAGSAAGLYEDVCNNCLQLLNESTGDTEGKLSIKILREEEAQGELKYYIESFGRFHGHTQKFEHETINKLRIHPEGAPKEAASIFEYIARRINGRKLPGQPRMPLGYSWDTSYFSNDYQGIKSLFHKPKDVHWNQYYKSGITTPITILNQVRGFLCYGSYKNGCLKRYHVELMGFHADMLAEVIRKVCPHVGHLLEPKDGTQCKEC